MWHTPCGGVAMIPRVLRLHPKTYQRLIGLRREADRDGAYRVAKRMQAVVLNSEGRTSGELAEILKAPRSRVSEWLSRYEAHGVEGLLEGYRPGRAADAGGATTKTTRRHFSTVARLPTDWTAECVPRRR